MSSASRPGGKAFEIGGGGCAGGVGTGSKGHSALQLSRDLDCQYMTAFVLVHKIREVMASEAEQSLSGEVEVDGAYFGGT